MSLENTLSKTRIHELATLQPSISKAIGGYHHDLLRRYGLSRIEWHILCVINDATKEGGIRVTDLAVMFDVKTTYITAALNSLRAKAYVDTRLDASDARVRRAVVTKKGSKEIPVIERYVSKHLAEYLDGHITDEELKVYVGILRKLGSIKA